MGRKYHGRCQQACFLLVLQYSFYPHFTFFTLESYVKRNTRNVGTSEFWFLRNPKKNLSDIRAFLSVTPMANWEPPFHAFEVNHSIFINFLMSKDRFISHSECQFWIFISSYNFRYLREYILRERIPCRSVL